MQCFKKIKPFFQSYKALKLITAISTELIEIVQTEFEIRADVICVFCELGDADIDGPAKRHAVQYCGGNWIISNLRKHVKNLHLNKERTKDMDALLEDEMKDCDKSFGTMDIGTDEADVETLSKVVKTSSAISAMTIIFENDSSKPDLCATLYAQFSGQNLQLIKYAMTHRESAKFMVVKINNRLMNIQVLVTKGDGNCLFYSLAHQIHFVKTNTAEHIDLSKKLRKDVVAYIDKNIEFFTMAISSRSDYQGEKDIEGCRKFVLENLALDRFWGGSETFLAVQFMYRVNIVVFMENGSAYFANGYKAEYNRSLIVAYRSCGKDMENREIFNHYDSVCGVNEALLYKCASEFAAKMDTGNKNDNILTDQ